MSLRVLITTDAVGGVWVYALALARGVVARGDEAELAVLGPAPGFEQSTAAACAGVSIHLTGLPLDWTAQTPEELEDAARALAGLATTRRADLVQLHTPALLGRARWPAPVLAVLHSCVGTWWVAMRGSDPAPEDFSWRMAAVSHGLNAADAVLAPSQGMAAAAQTLYKPLRDIRIVYNGSDAVPALPSARDGILAAGRLWDEAKNITVLDRAAAFMPDVPVSAAGTLAGPHGANITLTNIQWLGSLAQAEMRAALAPAAIFASPARYEPFGLAVLEAAQAGLALVLSDIPTFRELWEGAAIFLPPEDASAWADTLRRLHAAPDLRTRWGEAASTRATRYSAARFHASMAAEHKRLTQRARHAA